MSARLGSRLSLGMSQPPQPTLSALRGPCRQHRQLCRFPTRGPRRVFCQSCPARIPTQSQQPTLYLLHPSTPALSTNTHNPQPMAAPAAASPEPSLLSSPPWEVVPGICNFRDLGGYPIAGSTGSVKRGFIFRSAEPSHVTEAGMLKLLSTLSITTTYDLRSRPEVQHLESTSPVTEIPGITRHFIPVFEEQDLSPGALAARYNSYTCGDLTSAYRSILRAGAQGAYRTIFTHLLTRPADPLLIHCTAGKDRTGVVCALVLKLAGVDDALVAEEYALTSLGLEPFKEAIRRRLAERPVFIKGDEDARRGMENMLSSSVETMMETLKMVREEVGGVENYLERDCGFTKEEIETIRRNVTSDEPPTLYLDEAGKIAVVGAK